MKWKVREVELATFSPSVHTHKFSKGESWNLHGMKPDNIHCETSLNVFLKQRNFLELVLLLRAPYWITNPSHIFSKPSASKHLGHTRHHSFTNIHKYLQV